MTLAITTEHQDLAGTARALLAERGGVAPARDALEGTAPSLPAYWWDALSLGWLGLHVEERFGGQGFSVQELAIVVEELGRVVAPGPLLSTVVVAGALAVAGTNEQRTRWLPKLCLGQVVAAIGFDGSLTYDTSGLSVSGSAGVVLCGSAAQLLMLRVGDDLVLVDAADTTHIVAADGIDPGRPAASVSCASAPVRDRLPGAHRSALGLARTLGAAEALGGMRACLEMSVAHALAREQFGRPIGSFQAVKHHLANMLCDTELAGAATWDAARTSADTDEGFLAATVAAAAALDGYQRVAERTIQVHGGIGYTWEHSAHLYLRRASALSALFGPPEMLHLVAAKLHESGVRHTPTLETTEDTAQTRQAAREFLESYGTTPEPERRRFLLRSGYFVPHWPPPYGRGAGPAEQLVLDEVFAEVDRPSLGIGEWVLPTLLQCGSPDQVERWIWPSLDGDIRWCQMFSEPDAGSDAAAISTKGVRTQGGWLVNGQKVWTSEAHLCDHGLATVRTDADAERHAGITVMVIDLDAPGVEVRPLRELTGETLFNEVFLDDVFVPDDDVVGEVGSGWRVARATLGNERVSIGGGSTSLTAHDLAALWRRRRHGDIGSFREVGALLVEAQALRALNTRHAAKAVSGGPSGIEGNLAKLIGAEHAQAVAQLGIRLAGTAVLTGAEDLVTHDYLYARCLTIAGGTSEVLRSQIAERVLGMPR